MASGSAALGPPTATLGPATLGPAALGPAALGPAALGPAALGPTGLGPATLGPMAPHFATMGARPGRPGMGFHRHQAWTNQS